MLNTKRGKTADIPTFEQVLPEIADAISIRDRIHAELRATREAAATLRAEINSGETQDTSEGRVAAIIKGEPAPDFQDRLTALGKLHGRIRDLELAAEAQLATIRELERRASYKICDHVRAEYDALAVDACKRLIDLQQVLERYDELHNRLHFAGVTTTSLSRIGSKALNPKDPYGAIGFLLKEAAELGHIAKSEIPAAVRQ